MKNAISWFEIPSTNFERAIKFYETILSAKLRLEDSPDVKMAIFPYEGVEDSVGGAVVYTKRLSPSDNGTLNYLCCGDDLTNNLSKVKEAGGKVIMPKTSIGPNGYIALFIDTEGNKVGLHSEN
jgi:predicted enzyme related to lactoylglutathione lyase